MYNHSKAIKPTDTEKRYNMKSVTIFNRTFELVESKKYPITVDTVNDYMERYTGKDLLSFYNKPSDIKCAIYDDWRKWSATSHIDSKSVDSVEYMQVASANCMTFTIDALVFDKHGFIKYMLHITKSHNYAYPVITA